jgi:hypothetical protein
MILPPMIGMDGDLGLISDKASTVHDEVRILDDVRGTPNRELLASTSALTSGVVGKLIRMRTRNETGTNSALRSTRTW